MERYPSQNTGTDYLYGSLNKTWLKLFANRNSNEQARTDLCNQTYGKMIKVPCVYIYIYMSAISYDWFDKGMMILMAQCTCYMQKGEKKLITPMKIK